MAAAGRFVVPRINKKPRAEQLRDQRFKPGICEMCSTQVESLQILYEKPDPRVVATAAEDDFLAVMPTVTAVICKLCADLIKRFPEEDWTRFLRIAHYLGKRNLTRADIITE
jgi:hypothetical protein